MTAADCTSSTALTVICARGALITAGQLTGYDYTKKAVRSAGLLEDGPVLHVLASVVSAVKSGFHSFSRAIHVQQWYICACNVSRSHCVSRVIIESVLSALKWHASKFSGVRVCIFSHISD